jgi:hypothetical protein
MTDKCDSVRLKRPHEPHLWVPDGDNPNVSAACPGYRQRETGYGGVDEDVVFERPEPTTFATGPGLLTVSPVEDGDLYEDAIRGLRERREFARRTHGNSFTADLDIDWLAEAIHEAEDLLGYLYGLRKTLQRKKFQGPRVQVHMNQDGDPRG